jgi:cytochrome b pre-mRNA-processing protein 3
MFKNLFNRKPNSAKPLYEAIVAAARQPHFYTSLGVADTVEGRFDLLILHLYLVLTRIKSDLPDMTQNLIDTFCEDMDGNLREMGVGDLGVGKRVRRMAEALTGRLHAYENAIDLDTLVAALQRNVYQGLENQHIKTLALWVMAARASLKLQDTAMLVKGQVKFQ